MSRDNDTLRDAPDASPDRPASSRQSTDPMWPAQAHSTEPGGFFAGTNDTDPSSAPPASDGDTTDPGPAPIVAGGPAVDMLLDGIGERAPAIAQRAKDSAGREAANFDVVAMPARAHRPATPASVEPVIVERTQPPIPAPRPIARPDATNTTVPRARASRGPNRRLGIAVLALLVACALVFVIVLVRTRDDGSAPLGVSAAAASMVVSASSQAPALPGSGAAAPMNVPPSPTFSSASSPAIVPNPSAVEPRGSVSPTPARSAPAVPSGAATPRSKPEPARSKDPIQAAPPASPAPPAGSLPSRPTPPAATSTRDDLPKGVL